VGGIYALAVGVTVGEEHFSVVRAGGLFLLAYAGGVAIGLATTWLSVRVRRRLHDPFQHNLLAVITPLAAYLIAEAVDASGVLAVVVSGLWVSQASPRLFPAHARQYVQTVMHFVTSLANAALFVLVGLEVQSAVRGLNTVGLTHGLIAVAAISVAVIGVRFAWLFTSPYLIRLIDRRPRQRSLRLGARPRVVMAAAGFRGAVSLAAALSVPRALPSGAGFPDRDLIIFVTAGVIAVTLLVQAPLLPPVVRWTAATRRSSGSGGSSRSPPPNAPWPRSPRWPPTSAPARTWQGGFRRSTTGGCASCARTRTPRTARGSGTGRNSTPRCAWPRSPTSTRPSSA
jgi:CPA1 family monovalent cation:H+ antiporter